MLSSRLRNFIFGCVGLLSAWTATSQAATPHYVFAHYMVCYSLYGQSVAGFKSEIQDAQAAGIDGFALDVGEWNGPDTYYKTNVELMYEAAEALNNGFKLFFSVDMPQTNDIVQMISTYAHRTNSFYYNGKLVVSSFCGNGLGWTNVFQPLKSQGINVFFIPFFPPDTGSATNMASINALFSSYGSFLDGLFDFGCGLPYDINNYNAAYSQACSNAGKVFMAGCSPNYWGCQQLTTGRTYFESDGGEGTMTQWNWIVQNQPDWVEIVTWNDLNESTYINPLAQPDHFAQTPPTRYSHTGYLELTKRYITWYKTGQQPPITDDSFYYFYRTHSTNARASNTNDIPVRNHLGDLQDVIYTTAILTAPATLVVASGNNLATNSLPAGITSVRFPFAPGAQVFSLQRSGAPLMSVRGPDVLAQIQYYDYFPASGFIRSTPISNSSPQSNNLPPPPENLRVITR